MYKYHEREDELFARWMQRCKELDGINPVEDFAYDGLLFRGEYVHSNGCWERQPGNETELWNNAPCRILILTKDVTRNGGLEDVRIETARKNHTGNEILTTDAIFYSNLMLWSYALLNAARGGKITTYETTPSWDQLREHYCSAPIARVNCKKEIGQSSIANSLLKAHINRYADLLCEQIAMYDADIILCCGGSGIIKDFVKQHYLPDLVRHSDDGWVYYSPSTAKIVIDSYHPSWPKFNKEEQIAEKYAQMMADVKSFYTAHPQYLK